MWLRILPFMILPTYETAIHDEYDSVVWNYCTFKGGYEIKQLLTITYTRNGMRVEDWRYLQRPPTVIKKKDHVLVRFWDKQDRVFRCIKARTYAERETNYDIERRNTSKHPRDHRRGLTDPDEY